MPLFWHSLHSFSMPKITQKKAGRQDRITQLRRGISSSKSGKRRRFVFTNIVSYPPSFAKQSGLNPHANNELTLFCRERHGLPSGSFMHKHETPIGSKGGMNWPNLPPREKACFDLQLSQEDEVMMSAMIEANFSFSLETWKSWMI